MALEPGRDVVDDLSVGAGARLGSGPATMNQDRLEIRELRLSDLDAAVALLMSAGHEVERSCVRPALSLLAMRGPHAAAGAVLWADRAAKAPTAAPITSGRPRPIAAHVGSRGGMGVALAGGHSARVPSKLIHISTSSPTAPSMLSMP